MSCHFDVKSAEVQYNSLSFLFIDTLFIPRVKICRETQFERRLHILNLCDDHFNRVIRSIHRKANYHV